MAKTIKTSWPDEIRRIAAEGLGKRQEHERHQLRTAADAMERLVAERDALRSVFEALIEDAMRRIGAAETPGEANIRPQGPAIGQRASCRDCGRSILFGGEHWSHEGEPKPRHPAIPALDKPWGVR